MAHWDQEGQRLPTASLGSSKDITASQGVGQGSPLNGGQMLKAMRLQLVLQTSFHRLGACRWVKCSTQGPCLQGTRSTFVYCDSGNSSNRLAVAQLVPLIGA